MPERLRLEIEFPEQTQDNHQFNSKPSLSRLIQPVTAMTRQPCAVSLDRITKRVEAAPKPQLDLSLLYQVAGAVEMSLPLVDRLALQSQCAEDGLGVDEATDAHRIFSYIASADPIKVTSEDRKRNNMASLLAAATLYEMALPLAKKQALYDQYPDWLDVPDMVYLERFPQQVLIQIAKHIPSEVSATIHLSPTSHEDFEAWLEGEKGTRIRRALAFYASDRYHSSPICDKDDIEQRGLIYLWKKWHTNPAWLVQSYAGYIGKLAFEYGKKDRFNYRYWRGNHVNEGVALLEQEKGDEGEKPNVNLPANGHLKLPYRMTVRVDRRIDLERAIAATIQELAVAEEVRPPNGHRAPVAVIVRTICKAFMYHSGQTVREKHGTSSDGNMAAYWSQYITERQWYRWKPRVLTTLQKYLPDYVPV